MSEATLQPTGKLAPQAWMDTPETRALFAALQGDGKEARFIGGCVRNAVFGLPVKDIDIATPETPERVLELLHDANIRALPTGIDHGTITAIINGQHYEVTTLRIDVESHGRHATVAFTGDWMADALRRDLTINTLSCTLEGDIYDPLTGLDDLGQRWVRFVGRAKDRIEEDVLRLLRFFRFQATFGGTSIDREALAACRLLAPRLKELSAERVYGELFRILEAPNPADTLGLMKGERVLEHILPEAENFGRLRMLCWLETTAINVASVQPDPLRRLAATLPLDASGHSALAVRLRLSNKQTVRLSMMSASADTPSPENDEQYRRKALFHLGADDFRDLVLLRWAAEMSTEPRHSPDRTEAWLGLLEAADTWTHPGFPIDGNDAITLGLAQGPGIGVALGAVEDWWCEGNFIADRNQCMERLKIIIEETK
ncbi:MAG: CCA tRNA nucleotidyltransferase [Rhodospirillales bacterium]|nr:CCA tRNA nucleotidyltransferase [Rhodospirillales bacterium]